MEPSDTPFHANQEQPAPSPAAIRFAELLAERLDAVVPSRFRVAANGAWVSLYDGETWDCSIGVASLLDQAIDPDVPAAARESFASYAETVAQSVLSNVQDAISEATTDPWPALPDGGMALPGTRTDGERVFLWYGPDWRQEVDAVLSFPPIVLKELLRSD
jgi:hypothetical protein